MAAGSDGPDGALVGGLLGEGQRGLLRRYAEAVGSAPVNLVARRDRDDVWGRHVVECVAVAAALGLRPGDAWLDLGSGGGLPGVVMAVLEPRAKVVLLDARRRKTDAVRTIVEDLGLTNIEVVTGRAEQLARDEGHRGAYDGVVARAVGPLIVVAELARGFLVDGGRLVAVRGEDAGAEASKLAPLCARLALGSPGVLGIGGGPRVTNVVTMRTEGAPPAWLPRADGVPQRAPLEET